MPHHTHKKRACAPEGPVLFWGAHCSYSGITCKNSCKASECLGPQLAAKGVCRCFDRLWLRRLDMSLSRQMCGVIAMGLLIKGFQSAQWHLQFCYW